MRLVGLLAIAVLAAFVGGAGAALAEPTTTTPTTPATPTTPSGTATIPQTGVEAVDGILNSLAGNSGTGSTAPAENQTSQMIVATAPKASDTAGTLTAFERGTDGAWKPVIGPVKADFGELGMGEPKDNVHRTPVGTFALDQAFGREANPGTKMPYFQVTREDWWDSNMSSPTYNTHVKQAKSPGGDSENLYDAGTAYDYAVNIAHNPQRIPGKASAIFLHVSTGAPTAGCVSVPKDSMRDILKWLDPAKNPKITIGVNKGTPTDETANTPGTTTTSPDDKTGILGADNPLTGLLNQLVNIIPALLGTSAGSSAG